MLKNSPAFSGFSVNNLLEAKKFYGEILGLDVEEDHMGLHIKIAGSHPIFVYPKENHVPATYTILNFPVDNIDETVDALVAKGVRFVHYHMEDIPQDEKGIARGKEANRGPDIAWFEDPAGNILSILEK